jgi:putative flippase GtrA
MNFGLSARASEIARFVVVGVMATVVHFSVLISAVEYWGLMPSPANGIAFLCAVGVTFFGQSFWVFRGHGGLTLAKMIKFACSLTIGFTANLGIMAVCTRIFGFDYRIGFLACIVIVTVLNFAVNKLWVFRRVSA